MSTSKLVLQQIYKLEELLQQNPPDQTNLQQITQQQQNIQDSLTETTRNISDHLQQVLLTHLQAFPNINTNQQHYLREQHTNLENGIQEDKQNSVMIQQLQFTITKFTLNHIELKQVHQQSKNITKLQLSRAENLQTQLHNLPQWLYQPPTHTPVPTSATQPTAALISKAPVTQPPTPRLTINQLQP